MGKYIPVDHEKWAKMVQAQSDLPRWKEMCDELDARCNELKAEVERLRKAGDKLAKRTEFFQKRWDADELCQEVEAWNAAKEGNQS